MKKNLRELFKTDEQYQKELVYLLMLYDAYYEEVRKMFPSDDTIKNWVTLDEKEQKIWILNVFLPSLDKEYKAEHFNRAYWGLFLKKEGRIFIDYYKKNEPVRL